MSNLCIVYGWILNINNKRGYTTVTAKGKVYSRCRYKLKPSTIIGGKAGGWIGFYILTGIQ